MQDKYKTNCVYVTFYNFGGKQNRSGAKFVLSRMHFLRNFGTKFVCHLLCLPNTLRARHRRFLCWFLRDVMPSWLEDVWFYFEELLQIISRISFQHDVRAALLDLPTKNQL